MKILIFGIVASGKTTLAKKLTDIFDIPCYEGDCITWGFPNEERHKRSNEEQLATIQFIDRKGKWIIEGTYRESQKVLYDMEDKIIYLDTPLYIRRYRIVKRWVKQKFGLEKCHYKPDLNMLKHMFIWTEDFEKNRSEHEERLLKYKEKLIWLKSADQLDEKILL